jgi:hypothetical protein
MIVNGIKKTLMCKSPWKLEADMVFYKPWKTYAMVEQIRRLGIPTSGLVDGSQITKVKSPYGLSAPNIVLIMLLLQINYYDLAKCLALAKRYY